MRWRKSIRWRLQAWYGCLMAALLCGFALTAWQSEKSRQLAKADEALQSRAVELADALRRLPARGPELSKLRVLPLAAEHEALFGQASGFYYAVWMQGRDAAFASGNAPANLPRPALGGGLVRSRGEFREAFLFAAPVQCLLVGRSMAGDRAEFQSRAVLWGTLAGVLLGAGLLGGWWLTNRALRPVAAITQAAARIAEGDLSRRIDAAETEGELGRLVGVLNATFARLEAVFSQQGRFTSDAAHELRTPVAVILTQAQMALARERSPAEYRETLETIERATQRMRALIGALLELARWDSGQETLAREPCDLRALAAGVLETLAPVAAARGIPLEAQLAEAPFPGDAVHVSQVLTNLLANAMDYSAEGAAVRLVTRLEPAWAVFSVHNAGPVIAEEDLPRLFERFYRADKNRAPGGHHAGLGLAIVRRVVDAHGGEVAVQSSAGAGTVFTVRFPAGESAGS